MKHDEEEVTLGTHSKVRLGVLVLVITAAFSLVGSLTILAWKASSFASGMQTDMSWVKTSLATIVARFDSFEQLKQQVDRMERFGSSTAQDNGRKMDGLENRVKNIEEFGCQKTRSSLDELRKELEAMRREIELHEAGVKPKP